METTVILTLLAQTTGVFSVVSFVVYVAYAVVVSRQKGSIESELKNNEMPSGIVDIIREMPTEDRMKALHTMASLDHDKLKVVSAKLSERGVDGELQRRHVFKKYSLTAFLFFLVICLLALIGLALTRKNETSAAVHSDAGPDTNDVSHRVVDNSGSSGSPVVVPPVPFNPRPPRAEQVARGRPVYRDREERNGRTAPIVGRESTRVPEQIEISRTEANLRELTDRINHLKTQLDLDPARPEPVSEFVDLLPSLIQAYDRALATHDPALSQHVREDACNTVRRLRSMAIPPSLAWRNNEAMRRVSGSTVSSLMRLCPSEPIEISMFSR